MKLFIDAVYRKDHREVRRLLGEGFAINSRDADGRTALMHAVLDSEPDVKLIQSLIESGADVNAQDKGQQWSSLHFAARDHKNAVVSVLLGCGATVDALDVFGNTPLWRAVMTFDGEELVISMLLEAGASPTIENESGVSPRSLAEAMGRLELTRLLDVGER